MESNVKVLSPEELMPPLLELMEETDCVHLVISGSSMTPFLVHGRDTVYLTKVHRALQKGDMILYRRDSGSYILHRIYHVEADSFILVGDAQTELEYGVRQDQILALVCAVRRKGRLLQSGSFWWDFFQNIWIRMVPLRPLLRTCYCRLARLFR